MSQAPSNPTPPPDSETAPPSAPRPQSNTPSASGTAQDSPEAAFEPLEAAGDVPGPGPQAVLLCGLPVALHGAVTEILTAVQAPGHRVVFCTRAMVDGSLLEALQAPPCLAGALPPNALPPVVVLSGMTGEQIHGVIDRWRAARLPTPIWASTTPSNLGFPLRRLLRDLLAEHVTRPRQE